MSTTKDFAERLRSFREQNGLSQEQMAGKLGISRNYVSMIEGGKKPSESLQKLFEIMESSPLYASGAEGEEPRGFERGSSPRERLRQALDDQGLTVPDFARRMKCSPDYMEKLINGAVRAPEKLIRRIAKELHLDAEELLGGSDTPHIFSEHGGEGTHGAEPKIKVPPGTRAKYVPLLSWAQAGSYDIAHSDEAYSHTGVLALDVDDRNAFALEIEGDSMSPELQPGDRVIVAPSWTPRAGDTVIARTVDGDVYCKLYERQAGGKFRLLSINPKYPALELDPEEVAWIYPVAQITKTLRRS